MAEAKLYNQQGEKVGEITLNPAIFEVEANANVIKQVVVAQLANGREVIADTKNKGEVRGGGRKPWKQKGTGRARHGSTRSPIWKGGGVTFGPTTDRNFTKKVNKKVKKRALFMVLSEKAQDVAVSVIEELNCVEPKTKKMAILLKKMGFGKKTLVVVGKADDNVIRSIRNIGEVDVMVANSLNVVDLLKSKNILFTKDALNTVETVYLIGEQQ